VLLAAPLHAGVRAVRVADDERQVLLEFRGSWTAGRAAASPSRSNELSIGV
jgi:hypothetical protein